MIEWPEILLPPTYNMPFKDTFTRERVLAGFLAAATRNPISLFSKLDISDPNLNPEYEGDKLTIPDVRAQVPGWDAAVEMQRLYTPESYNRQLFRMGRLLAWHVKEKERYLGMPRVVIVDIAAEFNLIPEDDKYYHCFVFKDDGSGLTYKNSPLLITLELLKLPVLDDGTEIWIWCKFLLSTRPEEFEALMGRSEAVAEAVASLARFSADEKMRILAEQRELFLMDQVARMQYSEAKGRAEGRAEEQTKIARSMLLSNISVADIARFTGLSEVEVKRLSVD